jgi:hypothetical protein
MLVNQICNQTLRAGLYAFVHVEVVRVDPQLLAQLAKRGVMLRLPRAELPLKSQPTASRYRTRQG